MEYQLREQSNNVHTVVSPLWREPCNIHDFFLNRKSGPNTNSANRFRCEHNNFDFMRVQPHYYGVRLVEPCHH